MASRLIPLLVLLAVLAGCGGGADATTTATQSRAPFVASVQKSRARIWAAGDGAGGNHATEVANLVTRARPDRFLYLGDVYPMGTRAGFQAYARSYGRLASITAPTMGNHDWPVRNEGYIPYWRRIRGTTPPDWYSFRAGGWQIIELSSETNRRSQQLRWLRTQLRARTNCRIAFWHRPRFSAGPHGDAADMDPYWRALQGKARLVLSGHDHNMQRFAPRNGLIQIVSGAGGYTHYTVNRSRPGLAFADNTGWGALRIDLTPGRARLAFVATTGKTLDSQTVTCAS